MKPAAFWNVILITQLASPSSPGSCTPFPFRSLNFIPQIEAVVSLEVQLVGERKTPPFQVPAKRSDPLTARVGTVVVVNPVLKDVQFVPLSVE